MKVLFAVSNEEISESIVKKYQKQYKEIISYKNVYYFNAILKELQKDKNYDRIVISEELEAFTNTQYEQIDKFIFDKLDNITDEATNIKGEDIPIILICSDRREKSEEILVKIFGIGIYNALIGNDRSVTNVCDLLNKPRIKKDAKIYYKIDAEDVTYQAENENNVSEVEIQNILAHYKRLGKDEKKYVESFNNIASQYNDVQLRIISKFLPLNVRAVLEEQSAKYQQIISFNSKISDNLRAQNVKKGEKDEKNGTSEKLLNTKKENTLTNPVVIPSSVNMKSNIKLAKKKNEVKPIETFVEEKVVEEVEKVIPEFEEIEKIEEIIEEPVQEVKRGRGRPRKNPVVEVDSSLPKRGRGRPKKNVVPEEQERMILPGFDEIKKEDETILPGFDNIDEFDTILPGFDDDEKILPGVVEEEIILPNLEEKNEDVLLPGFQEVEHVEEVIPVKQEVEIKQEVRLEQTNKIYEDIDISNLLTQDKKIACFVGTSKNGTSFVVNNLAQIASQKGINTAILDMTKNKNSYYIYTKNEEELRKVAMNNVTNLLQGYANGIEVNKNLSVYTSLPDAIEDVENAGAILQTLVKKHSLILIDCDFETPVQYFDKAQELYLVQTYDILTIQPLTAFLRELKAKNVLRENKLRIVLNKTIKLRGINDKKIIGGIAYYNDPAMSFMTELFNKDTVRYITIPFNEDVYTKYLEGIINCEISIKSYPKTTIQILNELSNMVYPLVAGKAIAYNPPKVQNNTFTASMNSTLDQMKKKY